MLGSSGGVLIVNQGFFIEKSGVVTVVGGINRVKIIHWILGGGDGGGGGSDSSGGVVDEETFWKRVKTEILERKREKVEIIDVIRNIYNCGESCSNV